MTKIRIVKKPEERRHEIIFASRSLFLNKGYDNTTLQDIMTKLQIAKGTTYHYFKSKEELLDAVVEDMVDEHISIMKKSLNKCTGDALKKIRTLITTGMIVSSLTPSIIDALHHPNNREMHTRLLAVIIIKLAPIYANVIAQGCKEGVFHVDRPLECAEILLAGIQFITDIGYHPWSKKDLKRRMQAIPYLIENQLNAPKGVFNTLLKNNK